MKSNETYYTAFCQDASGMGTIWIEYIGPFNFNDPFEEVAQAARVQCADAWEVSPESIHCLGLARSEVSIAMWDDLNDD